MLCLTVVKTLNQRPNNNKHSQLEILFHFIGSETAVAAGPMQNQVILWFDLDRLHAEKQNKQRRSRTDSTRTQHFVGVLGISLLSLQILLKERQRPVPRQLCGVGVVAWGRVVVKSVLCAVVFE